MPTWCIFCFIRLCRVGLVSQHGPGSAWPSELGYHLSPGAPGPIRQHGATHMNIIRVCLYNISCSHYIANCSFPPGLLIDNCIDH